MIDPTEKFISHIKFGRTVVKGDPLPVDTRMKRIIQRRDDIRKQAEERMKSGMPAFPKSRDPVHLQDAREQGREIDT